MNKARQKELNIKRRMGSITTEESAELIVLRLNNGKVSDVEIASAREFLLETAWLNEYLLSKINDGTYGRNEEMTRIRLLENAPLRQLGKIYGISPERVRQIITRVANRKAQRFRVIRNGKVAEKERQILALQEQISLMKKKAIEEALKIKFSPPKFDRFKEVFPYLKPGKLFHGLSTRTINHLKRSYIKCGMDLMKIKNINELLLLKNFGAKSMEEVRFFISYLQEATDEN